MTERNYAIYDVFTDTPLTGNPLAVVFDGDGLSTGQMQNIAAEFNLSETVFIQRAEDANHTAKLRIFMPRGELPFAGHPTVGSTVAICERDGTTMSRLLMLEENVGVVRCGFNADEASFGEFDLPVLPMQEVLDLEKAQIASAFGLIESEIGFENHTVTRFNAGVPYICVPVHGLEQAAKAKFNEAMWLSYFPDTAPIDVLCCYLYCRETVFQEASIHARMFAPHHGIAEDPATGSAAAALSGALTLFDGLVDGPTEYKIEQGVEMGRPSSIRLELDARDGEIQTARIGGNAVKVAQGVLFA